MPHLASLSCPCICSLPWDHLVCYIFWGDLPVFSGIIRLAGISRSRGHNHRISGMGYFWRWSQNRNVGKRLLVYTASHSKWLYYLDSVVLYILAAMSRQTKDLGKSLNIAIFRMFQPNVKPHFYLVINSNMSYLTSLYSNLLDQIIVAKVVKICLDFMKSWDSLPS